MCPFTSNNNDNHQHGTDTASMSYHRPLSPGGRRIQNPGRVSDSLTDPYYSQRHGSYSSSPRTSTGGVIPISTQTFVNIPPPAGTRTTEPPRNERYESYSGRPRRSSLVDVNRGAPPLVGQIPSRNRPAVIQNEFGRPSSPLRPSGRESKEYYVTPAVTKDPRKMEHKKVYSVDDGTAKLVADVNMPSGGDRKSPTPGQRRAWAPNVRWQCSREGARAGP